jgi:hypothetical protein
LSEPKEITLAIPRGDMPLSIDDPKRMLVTYDVTEIHVAESRKFEIASVTPHKANELMSLFNNAFLSTTKILANARYQHTKAEEAIEKRKGVLIIDIIPGKLLEKGLATARSPAGSEDIRNAFISQDPDYLALCDRRDKIKAVMELFEGKKKFFENSYSSVKKILGENNYAPKNNALSGGHGDDDIGAGDNIKPREYQWTKPE